MIQQIKASVPLLPLVQAVVELKQRGKLWWGLCPFHTDAHPSFIVDSSDNHYHCWSCGSHGDVIDWVMFTGNISKAEAIKTLMDQAGLERMQRPSQPSIEQERETAKHTFTLLAAQYDTCLRECQRLSVRTMAKGDRESALPESLAERWHERDQLEATIRSFWQDIRFYSLPELCWQLVGHEAMHALLGPGEIHDGETGRRMLRWWAVSHGYDMAEWRAQELRRNEPAGIGIFEWLLPQYRKIRLEERMLCHQA